MKKILSFLCFSTFSFLMLGADNSKPFRCEESKYICGRDDFMICCPTNQWCCGYKNSPQFYCSETKECKFGY